MDLKNENIVITVIEIDCEIVKGISLKKNAKKQIDEFKSQKIKQKNNEVPKIEPSVFTPNSYEPVFNDKTNIVTNVKNVIIGP